jgi:hypothetical protein
MKYLELFENFLINEADSSIIGAIAKNLYLELSKMIPNNPLDINGNPLKNAKGDIITNDKKVKMSYQNSSAGMNKLAMQGRAKEIGNINGSEISLNYSMDMIHALGFVKKEEAENVLNRILEKYPKEITGNIRTNKMEYDWAKTYAPTYSIIINMKSDKELARTQSGKP